MIAIATPDEAPPAAKLDTITKLCADYDAQSTTLETLMTEMEGELEALKRKYLRSIKRQVSVVATTEAHLRSAVDEAPDLFIKPRTLTLHGVKVGFTKSKGSVEWDDDETVVRLIRKHHKDQEGVLIRTKETPNKDALRSLDDAELLRLGCTIEGAGDSVIVTRVAGDVEKLVNKLMNKLVEAMTEND